MSTTKRALVCQHQYPEIDRERGSVRVQELLDVLIEDGWEVTYLALDACGAEGEERYARPLRRRGVRTVVGDGPELDGLFADSSFDLALVAFWHAAERVVPRLRRASPRTRVLVDSVDLHFLREGRRRFAHPASPHEPLDAGHAEMLRRELNAYAQADAVLTVSEKEARLLDDLTGRRLARCVPLGDDTPLSPIPFEDRRGILFVGNFRHLPNREAVGLLCREVAPRLSPELLAQHPIRVVGSSFDEEMDAVCRFPGVQPVGWVPDLTPELHRARITVVPLLHGAGVKGKVIQSLAAGTPVVSTAVGVEGLEIEPGRHVVLADRPAALAAAITDLLSDAQRWDALRSEGRDLAVAAHGPGTVRSAFMSVIDEVMERRHLPAVADAGTDDDAEAGADDLRWRDEFARVRAAVADAIATAVPPDGVVLVVSGGDDEMVAAPGGSALDVRHHPAAPEGWHAGHHPADGPAAVSQLEALRSRGASHLVLPSTSFWWLHSYPELHEHLKRTAQLVVDHDECRVFALGSRALDPPRSVPGTAEETAPDTTGPIPDLDRRDGETRVAVGPTPATRPDLSVVIATHDRADLLERCLRSLEDQTAPRARWEVVVVDDGSTDGTPAVLASAARRLPLRWHRIEHRGRAGAKNEGIRMAAGPVVLLFDDDDLATPDLVAEHLAAHAEHPDEAVAVLGRTTWAPDLQVTPLMHWATEVGRMLLSYPDLDPDEELGWRHFWEGRVSAKRSLLLRAGLHDERLAYTIDIELGYRMARSGLRVLYRPAALSHLARPLDLASFFERCRAKGEAQRTFAQLHPDDEVREYCGVNGAEARWAELGPGLGADLDRVRELERRVASGEQALLGDLHDAYRRAFTAANVAGIVSADPHVSAWSDRPAPRGSPAPGTRPPVVAVTERPEMSVVVPVWSRTAELADMASATLDRVRRVAQVRTEVVVIDNGSPHRRDLPADVVVRHDRNLGVPVAWNEGFARSSAPVVAWLNSDAHVEPGWDRALRHAAIDGRRIAFPHTDHCDGLGPRRSDQAGTAGHCFAMRRDIFEELGTFDESFSPAYFEDTDYWHRAWLAGVELSPVPAAVVRHARRTTARTMDGLDWLFQGHRLKYGWKWGVPPNAPPPYYAREIVAYPPPGRLRLAALSQTAATGAGRPRVFGIGLNKTGTSSLHAALSHLGFNAVHHGEPSLRAAIEAARDRGAPLLDDVDPDLDAFMDIGVVTQSFALLDAQYPGSRFVLTTRDIEGWVASRLRHVRRNLQLRDRGEASGNFLDLDVAAWRAERAQHHAAVRAHFADRPSDLLVMDICAGDGWELLAPFVGWQRIPEKPFPWENPDPVGRPDSHPVDRPDTDPVDRSDTDRGSGGARPPQHASAREV